MTPEQYEAAWGRASPFFTKALRYGGDLWTLDEVRALVDKGEAHFWANETGFAVTQFVYSPRVKQLNYWLLGGDLDGLDSLLPSIEAWAIRHDCLILMGEGRRGFRRWLGPRGYAPSATLFTKDLRRTLQ